jgi:Ca2+-binding EF-hand superfamily protein
MKKTILGLSLFLLFAVSATAQRHRQDNPPNQNAKEGPPSASELLKKMDANKDGKLSKAEVKGPLQKDFLKVDKNKDGFLSKVELEKLPSPSKERQGPPNESGLLKKMDANKDGKLSKAEVKGPLQKDFSKVDKNKDGFLSKAELDKMPPPPRKGQGPPRG